MTTLPGEPVDIPLPPAITEAFGHRGTARFVGFTWRDGHLVGTVGDDYLPAQTWAFMMYRNHPAVGPLLAPFNLGWVEKDGTDMLIIDRELNRASVSPVAQAFRFLREQAEVTGEPAVDADPVKEQQRRIARLMSWLDMAPVADQGQTP